jgi:uncharacterized membrane protein
MRATPERTASFDQNDDPGRSNREGKKRSFERLLLFTDAVVAIAITLLILPVVERASEIDTAQRTVAEILREADSRIASFLLSFLVIAVMWLQHRQIFENVETVNSYLVWANLGWLLTVIFLAFTTALIPGHDAGAAPIYILNVALSSCMIALCATIVARHPDLLYPDIAVESIHLAGWWIATGLGALAVLAVVLVPAIGYYALLLLTLQPAIRRLLLPHARQSVE